MERAQLRVVEGLLEQGWSVDVVTRRSDLAPAPGLRVTRVPVPTRPFSVVYPLFAAWAGAVLALRRRREDEVRVALGAIVPNRVDAAVVQFLHHGFHAGGRRSRTTAGGAIRRLNDRLTATLSLAAERWCYRPGRVRALLPVSTQLALEVSRAFPELADATRIIPNGVDPAIFRPDRAARERIRSAHDVPESAALAVFVGGDWERKGLAIAIEALAEAPGWHLLVVGPGLRDAYERVAQAHGVADRVRFAGPQPQTAPYFAAADAFVLPTEYEGFALVSLEAAASGLPLLVTPASGTDLLVEDGVNGWTLERAPAPFAARLGDLDDPSRRTAMGQAARAAALEFSWSAIATRHAEVYDEILTSRR